MNSILSNGFVRPIIHFEFASGSLNTIIDTNPPTCFSNFHQNRSCKTAASFELTLFYVPGTFGENQALVMHEMLLSSVKLPVQYYYGYVTPGGGLQWQDQIYRGIFTSYTEDLQEGYLVYKINGIASAVEMITPDVNVEDFIAKKKAELGSGKVQPSMLLEEMINSNETGMREIFDGYELVIQHTDEEVPISSINIKNGPLQEVLCGKTNTDGTVNNGGIVGLSYCHPKSLLHCSEMVQMAKSGFLPNNSISKITVEPYVCYFDNVMRGGSQKGTFYYVPKYSKQNTNSFVYEYGNNYLNSDVLSFNVSIDCTVAMATIGSTLAASSSIDYDGNPIGTTYNLAQVNGFIPDSYTTISGLNSSSLVTASMIADALHFPYEATMTVIGQTVCNQLLDKIDVTIMFNGVLHTGLSGKYIILDISDELSDSGFTTTFKLQRDYEGPELPDDYMNNAHSEVISQVQENINSADWGVDSSGWFS